MDLVKRFIDYMFANKGKYSLNGYTFYAHNVGKFDSVFLIKSSVLLQDYDIKLTQKDNRFIVITIKNKLTKNKIKFYDSMQLINGKLKKILRDFGCKTQKGFFPHTFIDKNRFYDSILVLNQHKKII